MQIGNISKTKKGNYFKLSFIGTDDVIVCADTIIRFSLKKDKEISADLLSEILAFDRAKRVSDEAFDLISKRSFSAKSLSDKLKLKGYTDSEIAIALQKLENLDYINDERFAKNYALYLFKKAKGPLFVEAELLKHNIPAKTISALLKECLNENPQYLQIVEIIKVKYKGIDLKANNNASKAAAFFERKGFQKDDIIKALRCFDIDVW
jgi:regulatory protein